MGEPCRARPRGRFLSQTPGARGRAGTGTEHHLHVPASRGAAGPGRARGSLLPGREDARLDRVLYARTYAHTQPGARMRTFVSVCECAS